MKEKRNKKKRNKMSKMTSFQKGRNKDRRHEQHEMNLVDLLRRQNEEKHGSLATLIVSAIDRYSRAAIKKSVEAEE